MNSFELNKIAAAILLAGTTAMAISLTVNGLYGGEEAHHGEEPKRGYQIEVAEEEAVGGEAKEAKPVEIAQFFANASEEKGQALSKACLACHSFDKGGPHKVGPHLWGVVGADKAHHTDYSYSNALASAEGEWNYQSLSQFLEKPKAYVPGTKMAYAGMKKPEDRASMILYLRSLSDSPLPLPEPTAAVTESTAEEAAPATAETGETPPETKDSVENKEGEEQEKKDAPAAETQETSGE